jgi:hypothetical protein
MSEVDENLELIEEYIRKLKWSDDTPDIHKTLVAGNIRAFYAWVRSHLTQRAADKCLQCDSTENLNYHVVCDEHDPFS